MNKEMKDNLIAMQNNLGLGHRGEIILTTQERIDNNLEPLAKDIFSEATAKDFCHRWNSYEQQPPAGEWVKKTRKFIKLYEKEVPRRAEITFLEEACNIIDSAEALLKEKTIALANELEDCKPYAGAMQMRKTFEAINKDLLEALEEIRDLETECCSRCEGNGRLYADGKTHHISENADTILCGNCGGSGRILPENAQDIAEAAIAKAHKAKKRGGCWPEDKKVGG